MRELFCYDCGTILGDPVQSNIDNHTRATGHKDIKDREMLLDDGSKPKQPGSVMVDEHNLTQEQAEARMRAEYNKLQEEKETAELKKTVPSKKEQKEIEKLAEEDDSDSGNGRKSKKY